MTLPKVTLTQIDGALGVRSALTTNVAVVGCCSSGSVAKPAAYTRSSSLCAVFGEGPAVEMACHLIDRFGMTVVMVRADTSTDGTQGTTDDDGVTGTCVVTSHTGAKPTDAYEVVVTVQTGGTIGTAGIVLVPSFDGGRTTEAPIAIGTSTTISIGGGVGFVLAAGTLVAGDSWTVTTTAPMWDSTDIGDALTALGSNITPWDGAVIVGDLTGTLFDAVDVKIAGLAAAGKYHWWIGGFRAPNAGELDATYQAAFVTALGAKATIYGVICSGSERWTSSINGRVYTRPALFALAPRAASIGPEVDGAAILLGSLPGVTLRDDAGNLLHHDEAENPGLDDARASTLRTWEGYPGVYPTNIRIFSAPGSDFQFLQHRRVMNIALQVTYSESVLILNVPVRVSRTTGKILEVDRKRIENRINAQLTSTLLNTKRASDAYCIVAKDDNLLSGDPLTITTRVVPLAYPKEISASVGFINPALQAV